MMKNTGTSLAVVLAVVVLAGGAHAQSSEPEKKLSFDVASIKPGDPSSGRVMIGPAPGGGLRMVNVTLKQMIAFAYDVRDFQISGGPSWLTSERFEIVGKPEQSSQETDFAKMADSQRRAAMDRNRLMLRSLLEERFQLKLHKETKELPVYALVVAKDGPKMKAAEGGEGTPQNFRMGPGRLNATRGNMQMLSNSLANLTGRPVLDETGLKGFYDFELEWAPEPGQGPFGGPGPNPGGQGAPAAGDPSGPSIYTAIQQTLGLKLESKKGPVQTVVIDKAEKPTEN
jgi:uncharacterized protein (TIGR03435 family)